MQMPPAYEKKKSVNEKSKAESSAVNSAYFKAC